MPDETGEVEESTVSKDADESDASAEPEESDKAVEAAESFDVLLEGCSDALGAHPTTESNTALRTTTIAKNNLGVFTTNPFQPIQQQYKPT